jgi:alanine-synthesizing transaminase
MEFRRITNLPPYVFTIINNLKIEARRAGVDVIDLGFGNPDIPSPQIAVDKLAEAAHIYRNHRYSVSRGLPVLREAASRSTSAIGACSSIPSSRSPTRSAPRRASATSRVLLTATQRSRPPELSHPHLRAPVRGADRQCPCAISLILVQATSPATLRQPHHGVRRRWPRGCW